MKYLWAKKYSCKLVSKGISISFGEVIDSSMLSSSKKFDRLVKSGAVLSETEWLKKYRSKDQKKAKREVNEKAKREAGKNAKK